MLNNLRRWFSSIIEPNDGHSSVNTIELVEPMPTMAYLNRGSERTMATTMYWCDHCKKALPTEKGWKIHTTKVHGQE